MMNKLITLIAAFSLFTIAHANADTYYVSAVGSDTNNGTSTATPWKTLAKVNSIVFQPGDIISLRSGDTFVGSLDLKGSGDDTDAIYLSNYGAGSLPIISAGVADQAIRIFNREYWDISGVERQVERASEYMLEEIYLTLLFIIFIFMMLLFMM
jgi:hypothetical protein